MNYLFSCFLLSIFLSQICGLPFRNKTSTSETPLRLNQTELNSNNTNSNKSIHSLSRHKRQLAFAGGFGMGFGAYDYNDYYGDYVSDYAYDYYDWICSETACQLCDILTSECCDPDLDVNCFLPDSCFNNPCLSGGTCITTRTLDNRPDFICVCLPGLTGKYCQLVNDYFIGAELLPPPLIPPMLPGVPAFPGFPGPNSPFPLGPDSAPPAPAPPAQPPQTSPTPQVQQQQSPPQQYTTPYPPPPPQYYTTPVYYQPPPPPPQYTPPPPQYTPPPPQYTPPPYVPPPPPQYPQYLPPAPQYSYVPPPPPPQINYIPPPTMRPIYEPPPMTTPYAPPSYQNIYPYGQTGNQESFSNFQNAPPTQSNDPSQFQTQPSTIVQQIMGQPSSKLIQNNLGSTQKVLGAKRVSCPQGQIFNGEKGECTNFSLKKKDKE